ncbi:MAG: methyltransferase domain-containing protein [Nanoarchaeota archaeon]
MNIKETYESRTYVSNTIIKRKFVNRLKDVSGFKILDVGCGAGDISKTLVNKNDVHGIDLSARNVKIAKSCGIQAVEHSVENRFPYKTNTFDIIICSEIMEHLFNPENVIKESYRILKNGGSLLLSTPNFYSLINRLLIIKGHHTGIELPDITAREHIRFYSHRGLKIMLEANEFRIIRQEGIGFHPFIDGKVLRFIERNFKTVCDGIFIEAVKVKI